LAVFVCRICTLTCQRCRLIGILNVLCLGQRNITDPLFCCGNGYFKIFLLLFSLKLIRYHFVVILMVSLFYVPPQRQKWGYNSKNFFARFARLTNFVPLTAKIVVPPLLGIGFSGISDPGTRTGNESGTRVPVRFFGISLC
jgi:hypothetical protein